MLRKITNLNAFCSIRLFCTKMVRVLNVAEKNDAAKSLSDIMSNGRYRKREGFSRYNKIYEFDYRLQNQNVNMTMTSVSGHMLNFEFTGHFRKWHGCNPVALFDAPVMKACPADYNDIKRTLEREIRGCQWLVIWTDGDREGENIGFEIIDVCTSVKANLRVLRARFSEITPQAIQRACNNLLEPDKNVSDAVDVRQQLDLRIGASFTRFQTLRLQKVFPATLAEQLISYGSCQFPTLGFVVERFKQVEAFIPEPFWKIKVSHEKEDGAVEFNWKRGRLFDQRACLVLYQHVIENPTAKVEDVHTKPKSRWRPQALDTVELEKLASRKLRINAKETMRIAEKLYTQGYISYPRTETNQFPKDLNLTNLVQMQIQDQRWGGFADGILQDGGPNPRNGNKTDNAHPPIHPTKYANNLQGNEQKVYEFVVRHFLACCSKDAQGMETTVEIDINEEIFTAQGLMIIAKNFLEVYIYDKWNAKVIPLFSPGETFVPRSIEMSEGETSPPSLLAEADLIALMDKHGIGTDATHAEHIETIKARKYVGVRNDGKFVPGELGMGLVDGYDSMGFEMSKPHLRAELEANLKLICEGRRDKDVVLREQIQKYKDVFLEACNQAQKIDEALSQYFGAAQAFREEDMQIQAHTPVKPCPLCGQPMTLKSKKDGKGYFIGCSGYPQCNAVMWLPDFVLQASVQDTPCDRCQTGQVHNVKFKFKRGSVPAWVPLDYIGCVGGCDDTINEVLNIHGATGAANTRPGSGTQRNSQMNRPRNNGVNDSGYSSGSTSTGQASTQQSSRNKRAPLTPKNGSGQLGKPKPKAGTRSLVTASAPTNEDENAVVCNCGQDAISLTVRKEGPNQGRPFFKCSQPQGSGCNFFLWGDDTETERTNNEPDETRRYAPTSQPYRNNNMHGNNEIKCGCSLQAKQLTVQKEGPNKGREFYTCNKPRGEGCNFFQWADEPPQTPTNNTYSRPANQNNSNSSNDVQCGCGLPAKSLTVSKDGPNKGRPFYACNKPRGQNCDFFQWADEVPSGSNEGFNHNRRNENRTSTTVPAVKKKRTVTCKECNQQGHTKKTCPRLR